MKTYAIYYFNVDSQETDKTCHSAIINKAESAINALKIWHNHINTIGGQFKNFCYTAIELT